MKSAKGAGACASDEVLKKRTEGLAITKEAKGGEEVLATPISVIGRGRVKSLVKGLEN